MIMLAYLFGALLIFAGIMLIINPELLFSLLVKNISRPWIYIAAIFVRLIFGGVLIYAATLSSFPFVILVLGWIMLIASAMLLVMGHKNFQKLISWVVVVFRPYGRVGGVFSAGFGLFLVYAFI